MKAAAEGPMKGILAYTDQQVCVSLLSLIFKLFCRLVFLLTWRPPPPPLSCRSSPPTSTVTATPPSLTPALASPSTTTLSSWCHGEPSAPSTRVLMSLFSGALWLFIFLASQSGTTTSLHTATVSATWWPTWLPRSKTTSWSLVAALRHIAHILLIPELYRHNLLSMTWLVPTSDAWGKVPTESRRKRFKLVTNYFFVFVKFPVLFLWVFVCL